MMAWYWHGHDGGVGTWLWLAWMVLFWGGLLAAGVYFIRRRPTHVDAGPDAEDVLAERYARGEIDDDEYRQRRAVLHEHRNRGRAT
ncbi:MAG TPA: SHOCT domain-containing protein [Actinomycetota bacterium]|jgi:putative membrane protein